MSLFTKPIPSSLSVAGMVAKDLAVPTLLGTIVTLAIKAPQIIESAKKIQEGVMTAAATYQAYQEPMKAATNEDDEDESN